MSGNQLTNFVCEKLFLIERLIDTEKAQQWDRNKIIENNTRLENSIPPHMTQSLITMQPIELI